LAVGLYNYGYIPLTLTAVLFGSEILGVLLVWMVGEDLTMWTLGVMLVSGRLSWGSLRHAFNAPACAIVLSVLINLLGWSDMVPRTITLMTSHLGQSAVPMALLLIGGMMVDEVKSIRVRGNLKVPVAACVLRLGILPMTFLAIPMLVSLTPELTRIVIVQAAMPSAMFPIILSRHYGGETSTALRVILSTSLAGLVTIPLWLAIGRYLFAL
jgi:predicted permease